MRDGLVGWPAEFAERYRRDGYWTGQALAADLHRWGRPDKIAVIDGPTRIDHRTLAELTDGLAQRLSLRGVRRGDNVLVQLPNCAEFVVLTLACLRLGVAPIMALPAHRRHELQNLAVQSDAVAIVLPDNFRDFDHQRLGLDLVAEIPTLREAWVVGDQPHPDAVDLRALIAPADDPAAARRVLDNAAPDGPEVAMFLLSGGTTGTPKIIPRTHDDYAYNVRRCAELSGTGADSVYLVALPAGHNFPLGCPGILGTLRVGGTVVMARSPEPGACFELIAEHGVTHTSAVPAVAQRWIEEAATTGAELSSLRVLQVGGSRIPEEVARRVGPVLNARLQQAFGMAEGLINFTRLDDPDGVVCETQGRPMCEADEIRVVDEQDRDVPDGESGLLLTRGPYTLRGYYRAPEHNERAFTADGWYRTGDLVRRLPSGNLVVDGRVKDVIVRGGEKISAEEVENLVYLAVPSVSRVAAVATPDPRLGERVAVVVVPKPGGPTPTLAEVRAGLSGAGCAAFKLPDRLELVDALPVTPVGKVDKNRLRAMLAEHSAGSGPAGSGPAGSGPAGSGPAERGLAGAAP